MAVDAVLRAAMKGFNDEETKIGAIIRVGQPRDSQDQDIAYISLVAVVERRSVDLKRRQAQVDLALPHQTTPEDPFWRTKIPL